MENDVDGNLAALRQYERAQDAADIAQEHILALVQDQLKQITELAEEVLAYGDHLEGYDFDETLQEWLDEAIHP